MMNEVGDKMKSAIKDIDVEDRFMIDADVK